MLDPIRVGQWPGEGLISIDVWKIKFNYIRCIKNKLNSF